MHAPTFIKKHDKKQRQCLVGKVSDYIYIANLTCMSSSYGETKTIADYMSLSRESNFEDT